MERRGGEWDREMTAGRIQTCVPVGVQARIWSGLLLAPQCHPHLVSFLTSLLSFSLTTPVSSLLFSSLLFSSLLFSSPLFSSLLLSSPLFSSACFSFIVLCSTFD